MNSLALAATDPVIVVDELVDGKYSILHTGDIRKSRTNRKKFDDAALHQLAASIKEQGVIQPILVRPVAPTAEEPEVFELVAGERRWRASIIAGVPSIPAIIRRLSDLQAAEIQILENLQREDPHPLEEAEGYEQLMMKHGYNADQLADKIHKSRSYIYGRLKLCALTLAVRERFLKNEISPSIALIIARIPVPSLQIQALGEILLPFGPGSHPLSYRDAVVHIQRRYMLDLDQAVFPIADAKLLAPAGACPKCPKRAGNQPELFEDVKSANVCTDPSCFAEKRAAHYARTIVQANKSGIPVYESPEDLAEKERGLRDKNGAIVTLKTQLWNFQRVSPATGMAGNVESNLPLDQRPPAIGYVKSPDGSVMPLFDRAAVQSALEKRGACETEQARDARAGGQSAQPAGASEAALAEQKRKDEAWAALEEEAKTQTAFRVALYLEMRRSGPGIELVREAAKRALDCSPLPVDLLGDEYKFDTATEKAIRAHIDQAPLPDVLQILIDMMLGELLVVSPYNL